VSVKEEIKKMRRKHIGTGKKNREVLLSGSICAFFAAL
jgi:hypothetical protein